MSVANGSQAVSGAEKTGTADQVELGHHHEELHEHALKTSLATSTPQAWHPVSAEEKAASRKLNRKLDLMVSNGWKYLPEYQAAKMNVSKLIKKHTDSPTSCNGIHVQPARQI